MIITVIGGGTCTVHVKIKYDCLVVLQLRKKEESTVELGRKLLLKCVLVSMRFNKCLLSVSLKTVSFCVTEYLIKYQNDITILQIFPLKPNHETETVAAPLNAKL